MAQNILRQETQIRKSDTYNGAISAGQTALETNSTDLETDLNSIRSQVNRLLAVSTGNWYDDIATANSKKRAVSELNTDLDDMEEKRLLCGVEVLVNVTVPASQNYVVLVQASSQTPTDTAAIGTGLGTVVAVLGTDVGAHSLTEVAGKNALRPKNLLTIREASTKDPITSNGQQVYGLLQAETGVVQGDAFNDTDKQVQISFVRNNGSDDLEAVPFADIQNKVIEYVYGKRITLDALPEDCNFPYVTFTDQNAATDITLDTAIDNQGATAATQTTDINVNITDTKAWNFRDPSGATNILQVLADTQDKVTVNGDLDINNVNSVDMAQGLQIDTGDQTINVGHTAAGKIDSTSLLVEATSGTAELKSSSTIIFTDGNLAGSTYDTPFNLSDASSEYDDFETEFGEVSLINAIVQAKRESGRVFVDYEITTQVTEDNDMIPGTNATVVNGTTPDLSLFDFVTEVTVFHNGNRQINGANAAANNNCYPGTTPASGHIKFESKKLRVGDTVTVEYVQK